MYRLLPLAPLLLACAAPAAAQQPPGPQVAPPQASATGRDPALTVYNGGFAVVRETLDLSLAAGVNQVSVTGMTGTLEPDSVILRDPAGTRALAILEQSYRNDPVTQERLLQHFEGQTIRFHVQRGESVSTIEGRIVRSGYAPPVAQYDRWGNWVGPQPQAQPVIEVDGELRFTLPGLPLFPSLGDDTVLQPTLGWVLRAGEPGPLAAELAYVTGGFTWEADYNAVSEEGSGTLDLVGWITMQNRSGKTFREARVKLMAGDVSKVADEDAEVKLGMRARAFAAESDAAVTEKAFDEFHLYTVARPLTLRDAESKQVEMVRAEGVPEKRLYVYDGAAPGGAPGGDWGNADFRYAHDFGVEGHKKVWVVRQFRNDAASGLGVPLPKGKVRFYTRDRDGQLEFTGENLIDHTPKDETLRLYTGNAFDLVGERTRTDFRVSQAEDWLDEAFTIRLRNHKAEPVTFTVVEHLYRWSNWEVRKSSHPYAKKDSRTIEFTIEVPADGEVEVGYGVHYSW